jgi:hypothetical protein
MMMTVYGVLNWISPAMAMPSSGFFQPQKVKIFRGYVYSLMGSKDLVDGTSKTL